MIMRLYGWKEAHFRRHVLTQTYQTRIIIMTTPSTYTYSNLIHNNEWYLYRRIYKILVGAIEEESIPSGHTIGDAVLVCPYEASIDSGDLGTDETDMDSFWVLGHVLDAGFWC